MPSSKTIKSIVVKLEIKYSVFNLQKGVSGRPKDWRAVENIETVRLAIEDPKESYRKRDQALNIKPSSLLTILRTDFKLVWYKYPLCVQKLSNADKTAKLAMCQRFQ